MERKQQVLAALGPRQRPSSVVTRSKIDAVVVDEYCGYIGSTSSRCTFAARSRSSALVIEGLP
jgi:hypothetical protein